jgi:hypothetical protein
LALKLHCFVAITLGAGAAREVFVCLLMQDSLIHRVVALSLLPAVMSATTLSETSSPTELALAVKHAEDRRDASVQSLVSVRRYTLRNKRWKEDAVMMVRMITEPSTGKRFEIVDAQNVVGLQKRALLKILEGEVDASRKNSDSSEITPDNYDFAVLGMEHVDGRQCLVMQLAPKTKSKLLINGKAWVDVAEQAIIRLEGRTAGNVSFWIGKPYIVQKFKKVDDVWLSAHNQSVSDVRWLGRTELIIEYIDYEVGHYPQSAAARRP